jgi:hypothetical protein
MTQSSRRLRVFVMPYIYAKVDDLEGAEKVGGGACARLVQVYGNAPQTSAWKEGAVVKGHKTISKGTAIATFVNGVYPNKSTGNHAALYVSQDANGITVMDQWKGESKPNISSRVLRFKGKKTDGTYVDPSNNGDAFSVIE